MSTTRDLRRVSLARDELLAVTDGEATTIRIERGEVWVTEHGSFIDHILSAGQRYTFDRPGVALVAAQRDSRVSLYLPRVGPPPASVERKGVRSTRLYAPSVWWRMLGRLWPASMRKALGARLAQV
jgi:Protein of unknown function (DUF2917)